MEGSSLIAYQGKVLNHSSSAFYFGFVGFRARRHYRCLGCMEGH